MNSQGSAKISKSICQSDQQDLDKVLKVLSTLPRNGFVYQELSKFLFDLQLRISAVDKMDLETETSSTVSDSWVVLDVDNNNSIYRLSSMTSLPPTIQEAFVIGFHANMMDKNFVCLVECPNAIPGFAPSLKGDKLITFVKK
jgi:hypothetical protein